MSGALERGRARRLGWVAAACALALGLAAPALADDTTPTPTEPTTTAPAPTPDPAPAPAPRPKPKPKPVSHPRPAPRPAPAPAAHPVYRPHPAPARTPAPRPAAVAPQPTYTPPVHHVVHRRVRRHHPAPRHHAKPKPAAPPRPTMSGRADRDAAAVVGAPAALEQVARAAVPALAAPARPHGPQTLFILLAALGFSLVLFAISLTPRQTLKAVPFGRVLVRRQADAGFLGLVVLGAVALGFLLAKAAL